jgi:hypothetical protein
MKLEARDIKRLVLVSDMVWDSHEWEEVDFGIYLCKRCGNRGKAGYLVVEGLDCDECIIRGIIE